MYSQCKVERAGKECNVTDIEHRLKFVHCYSGKMHFGIPVCVFRFDACPLFYSQAHRGLFLHV